MALGDRVGGGAMALEVTRDLPRSLLRQRRPHSGRSTGIGTRQEHVVHQHLPAPTAPRRCDHHARPRHARSPRPSRASLAHRPAPHRRPRPLTPSGPHEVWPQRAPSRSSDRNAPEHVHRSARCASSRCCSRISLSTLRAQPAEASLGGQAGARTTEPRKPLKQRPLGVVGHNHTRTDQSGRRSRGPLGVIVGSTRIERSSARPVPLSPVTPCAHRAPRPIDGCTTWATQPDARISPHPIRPNVTPQRPMPSHQRIPIRSGQQVDALTGVGLPI